MSPLTNKQTITPNTADDTSVKPIEKEILQSTSLENGIHFFGGQCLVRVANRLELRQKAYELLYKLYSKNGIVQRTSDSLWVSIYDALPETTTIIAEHKGEIEGALTLVFDSPIGLPADELYKKEIDGLRNSGRKLCEIISFGNNKAGNGSVKITASLFYSAYLLSLRIKNSTDFVITVHARYEPFYCGKLLFKKIGPVRNYSKVKGKPTVLLKLPLDLPEKKKEKRHIFPISMLKYPIWKEFEVAKRIQNTHSPMSDEEFYKFFIEKSDVWENASKEQKDYIKRIFPANRVDHFSVSRALAKGVSKRNQHQNDIQNGKIKVSKI